MSDPRKFNAEEADNLEDIEKQFAVAAVEQAGAYWSLLEKIRASDLKTLTGKDDEIYDKLIEAFPQAKDGEFFKVLTEDVLKSKGGKELWRNYCNTYEKSVDDFNFGTLLRLDASKEYSEENTTFGYRVQFYAIEIWRNRHGWNDWIYEKAHKA